MYSLVKFAFLALISFAALALAIPSPAHPQDPRALITNTNDPKALITDANLVLERTLLPLHYINSANATSESIGPVIRKVGEIVAELISDLRGSSLSSCGCTAHDIVTLIAITFKIMFEPFGIVYESFSPLVSLLGNLVVIIVELLDVVFELVGGPVRELLYLLVRNGSARIIFSLKLGTLVDLLGLGEVLGHLW